MAYIFQLSYATLPTLQYDNRHAYVSKIYLLKLIIECF